MSDGRVFGERLLGVVMLLHPRGFRSEYAEEMVEYYRAVMRSEGERRGWWWRCRYLAKSVGAAVVRGVSQRVSSTGERRAVRGATGRGSGMIDTLSLDLRYAVRSIVRRRRFASVVVLVLALGMGANTGVFGVLNAVLLRPLPYPDPDRLVRIYQTPWDDPDALNYVTMPAFLDVRENARTFAAVAALYTYSETGADLTGAGEPVRVRLLAVTPDYFAVMGADPVTGHGFGEEHALPGVQVAVVSASLAASGGVSVGQSLVLDGVSTEVLGILPPGYEDAVAGQVDVLVPLVMDTEFEDWQWDNHYLTVIGRLEPGVTLGATQTDVERRFAAMNEVSPMDRDERGRVVSLHEDVVGNADTLLLLLMGAVGFLLLVACVNVAGLFLARGAARERELAVRTALGSPRWRVVRQLLLESVLLSAGGAAAGLLLGRAVSGALVGLAPADLVPGDAVPFDLGVFGFSAAMAIVAGVFFGLAPALLMSGTRIEQSLRRSGRGGGSGVREGRSRDVLVVIQLAVSLVLLVGAGLLLRSFDNLRRSDLGFRSAGVMTFEVHLPSSRYDAAARVRFYEALHEQLAGIPGVRAVAAASHLPVTGRALSWGVREFVGDGSTGQNVQADQRTVQGAYFAALRIPVLAGRVFGLEDDSGAPPRVVISESLARQLFPSGDAVGRRLRVIGAPHEIIGVVGDAAIDARGGVAPMVYHSHRQFADNRNWAMRQVVAMDGEAPGVVEAARRALAGIDPSLVLHRPAALETVVSRDTARDRFATLVLVAFAGVAAVLAAVGVYGVLAYSVGRRRHEFGVRMALGARSADVRGMVVRRGAFLAAGSIALGLAAALALASTLNAFVFGVSVRDPATFTAACFVIGAVALLASWVPAVSATRVDPVSAFRSE